MDIRKAKKDEIKLVADMTQKLFEDEPSDTILSMEQFEDRLLKYINAGCEVFLFIEEEIIGYALVNLDRNPYYLIDFFICRHHRRGGKGTKAFNFLMNELNTESIDLDVFCWNERGKKFWESLGFKERAIIMRKLIKT
ncbi:MAG: GNAT family N-acetyltransferase [Bacillota bacterium]